jgi:hypothetical protein
VENEPPLRRGLRIAAPRSQNGIKFRAGAFVAFLPHFHLCRSSRIEPRVRLVIKGNYAIFIMGKTTPRAMAAMPAS